MKNNPLIAAADEVINGEVNLFSNENVQVPAASMQKLMAALKETAECLCREIKAPPGQRWFETYSCSIHNPGAATRNADGTHKTPDPEFEGMMGSPTNHMPKRRSKRP